MLISANNTFKLFIKTLSKKDKLYKFLSLLMRGIEVRITRGPLDCMKIVFLSMDGKLNITDCKQTTNNIIEFNKMYCIISRDDNRNVILFNKNTNTKYCDVHFRINKSANIFADKYNTLSEKYNNYIYSVSHNRSNNRSNKYKILV